MLVPLPAGTLTTPTVAVLRCAEHRVTPCAQRSLYLLPFLQGGSGYNPGFAGYGGGGAAPPQNFQAAADAGALRDKSNDVCYK